MKRNGLSPEKMRKKARRLVKLIRAAMNLAAPVMNDMEKAIGEDRYFETAGGRVRALCYGFENAEITPLLVNMHGSGFVLGSAAMDDPFMMQFVENCGVKVLSIDYTLAPDEMFPFALEQCYSLIRHAREHPEELGIDPERIMIMGHSAGGNFCAAIGILEKERRALGLKGIILDYPPLDIATDAADKPRPKAALPVWLSRIFDSAYCLPEQRRDPLVSPALADAEMLGHFPPTLIITAGQDSLAAEAERFAATLESAGVDVTLRRFEDAIHGFTVVPDKAARKLPALRELSREAWALMIDYVNLHI